MNYSQTLRVYFAFLLKKKKKKERNFLLLIKISKFEFHLYKLKFNLCINLIKDNNLGTDGIDSNLVHHIKGLPLCSCAMRKKRTYIVLGSVNLLDWVKPPKRDLQDLDDHQNLRKKNVKKGARSIFRSQQEIKKPIKVRNSIDSRICLGHYFIILFSKIFVD